MTTDRVQDFLHYLSTGEDPNGLVSPDVVAEMNFPHQSFTLTGKAELDAARAQVSDHPWVLRPETPEPLPDGFMVVVEYDAGHDGKDESYRTLNLVTLEGDRVTRFRHWCTGAVAR